MSKFAILATRPTQIFGSDAKSLLTFGFSGSRARMSADMLHGMTLEGLRYE